MRGKREMKEADNAINGRTVEVLLNQETVTLLHSQRSEADAFGALLLDYQVQLPLHGCC